DRAELIRQLAIDVTRQLPFHFRVPVWKDSFGIERREIFLDPVHKPKIDRVFPAGMSLCQHRYRFARIVIAVMKEKYNFAADLGLQAPGRNDLGVKKPFWEKTARLLPETNDRLVSRRSSHCSFLRAISAKRPICRPSL